MGARVLTMISETSCQVLDDIAHFVKRLLLQEVSATPFVLTATSRVEKLRLAFSLPVLIMRHGNGEERWGKVGTVRRGGDSGVQLGAVRRGGERWGGGLKLSRCDGD